LALQQITHARYWQRPKTGTIEAKTQLQAKNENIMRVRFPGSTAAVTILAAIAAAVSLVSIHRESAHTPPAYPSPQPGEGQRADLKALWGKPDLGGIWTDQSNTRLQRPAKYADQEFFTAAQRAELDKARSGVLGQDRRAARGTELDLSGAYNSSLMCVDARTSLIVDPLRQWPDAPESRADARLA
jgi:hypothetical protein